MKRYLLVANKQKDVDLRITQKAKEYLIQKGVEDVCIACVDRRSFDVPDTLIQQAEIILVFGGDGTLLRIAKQAVKYNIPLLGINLGHLGYLSEVDVYGINDALDALCENRFELQKRMMIEGRVYQGEQELSLQDSWNDIVITRGGSLQILHFNVWVNGLLLRSYAADGVIIATPTGSTAYNLSAGGPIVEPGANLIVLTPISPHTLMSRSIILKAEDEVTIEIMPSHEEDERQSIEVNFDGAESARLQTGDRVTITKSNQTVSMVKFNNISFLETLHRKLSEG